MVQVPITAIALTVLTVVPHVGGIGEAFVAVAVVRVDGQSDPLFTVLELHIILSGHGGFNFRQLSRLTHLDMTIFKSVDA